MTTEELTKTTKEASMERQVPEKRKKYDYDKIHVGLILFISLEVLFLFTFSEPMNILWGGEPLFGIYNDDLVSRSGRLIMIYHALATPFVVATTFWCMEYFEVRERLVPSLKLTLIPGSILSGICGLFFAYSRIRFFHELFYIGLALVFLGGVLFIVAAFPIPDKFPKPEHKREGADFFGIDLENYSIVILAFCVLVSVAYGALAAMEIFTNTIWKLDRPHNDAFLAEEIVRILLHDNPEEFIVSHLHIQLSLLAAMVTMIGYKISEIKGRVYHYMLFACPIGIVTISYGAWVLNHYLIWVGAGILILCTVALSLHGLREISKDHLGENYESASKGQKVKSIVKDPTLFTLYFIFLYAQIVVTICGIIVGLKTREVYRLHEWVDVEYDFNVGHWHLLAVLLATLVLLIAINHFKKEMTVKSRKFSGFFLFFGGFVAFSAGNLYMMRDPADNKLITMYITFVGVWFLTVGFALGIIQIVRANKKRHLKAGDDN